MLDMNRGTLGSRLREERKAKGWSQTTLGREGAKHGAQVISKQVISKIEKDETLNPDHATIRALSLALGVTDHWLLDGSEPKHPGQHVKPIAARDRAGDYTISPDDPAPGYIRLPILNMGDSGMDSKYDKDALPEVVRHLDVASWWAKQKLPDNLEGIHVLSARGDSMAGLINHGDILFVDAATQQYDGEGLYVFNVAGKPHVRRLAPSLRSGAIQVLAHNSAAYPAEDVSPGDLANFRIAGRVAAWWTLRTF